MRVAPLVHSSSVDLPTRRGHDHARHLLLDARWIAQPGGMDVRDELALGPGMGGAVAAAECARHGPLGAAAQLSGRVALRAHAGMAEGKGTEGVSGDGW